jgi:ParB family chromosome partitioning protein
MTNNDKSNPRKGALGKGINSLLGDFDYEIKTPVDNSSAKPSLIGLPILSVDPNFIDPNPAQPRKSFNPEDLRELAASIATDGVLQPLIVTKSDVLGRYTLIAGERRLRASKMAGLMAVPVILKEGVNHELLRLALIENIQRADLNVIEEAYAYESLIKEHGLTQEECAKKVGKERSTVANALRMIQLPKEVQTDIIEKRLTMGHGRALLPLEDKKEMLKARDLIIKKKLSVRQAEQICQQLKSGATKGPQSGRNEKDNPNLEYIAETLRTHLRTKVRMIGSGSRGRLEISYFSPSELERVLSLIGPRKI